MGKWPDLVDIAQDHVLEHHELGGGDIDTSEGSLSAIYTHSRDAILICFLSR